MSVKLLKKEVIKLPVIKPFNFRYTFWKPSHFKTGFETHSPGVSWRTFRIKNNILGIRFEMENGLLRSTIFSQQHL